MTTGIYVQTEEPYNDLYLDEGDHWARHDDQVFVYSNGHDSPVAEIAAEHFVSAAKADEEAIPDIDVDGSEVNA